MPVKGPAKSELARTFRNYADRCPQSTNAMKSAWSMIKTEDHEITAHPVPAGRSLLLRGYRNPPARVPARLGRATRELRALSLVATTFAYIMVQLLDKTSPC